MFLDEFQKRFQEMQTKTGVRAVFGEVIEVDGRKLIPVAGVTYLFGMGGGQGPTRQEKDEKKANPPLGGGGGGGMRVEPIAVIEVTADSVKIQPIVNVTRVAICGLLVGAWSIFWISRAMRYRNTQ